VGESFTAGSEVGTSIRAGAFGETHDAPVIKQPSEGGARTEIVLRAESLLPLLSPSLVIVSFYQADVDRAALKR